MLNKIRTLFFPYFFKAEIIGKVRLEGAFPIIRNKGHLQIKDGTLIRCKDKKVTLNIRTNARLSIGKNVLINSGASISTSSTITIGDNTKIGDCVLIDDNNFHAVDEDSVAKVSEIKIGNNVWIGKNAIILPGIEIGDHSVIGAGSVVTKSVPSKTLVSGNPAMNKRDVICSDNFIRK